jgi:5-methyltetrahydropteroyltriglutamate--homocysteine methyltransferase
MTPNYRADHVGSLLRPPELLQAHDDLKQGRISHEQLAELENHAILQALEVQKQVGIEVWSDGEYRRGDWAGPAWAGDFPTAVEGYEMGEPPMVFDWKMPEELAPAETRGQVRRALQTVQAALVIARRLRQKHRLTEHEVPFLKEHARGHAFKITMPATSYVLARGWKPGLTDQVYGSRWELAEDIARIMHAEVMALAADGVPYIQIDNAHWPDYIPADRLQAWRSIGIDPDKAIDEDVRADNLATKGLDRSNITLATHICRGNGRSMWHTEGGYEPIAERVFGGLDVDRFLLEYDSDRAGGFEPLRFVPKGRQVVLGLVTTKLGALEKQDDLLRRIDEASKYIPMENLALSPQCGFASVEAGNLLSWDEQRRKLELVVDTARKAWG